MIDDKLTLFLEQLKSDLIASLEANSRKISLNTIAELEIIHSGDTTTLQIPGYLALLETGRRPTGPIPIPGDVPMIQRIQQWCREKGIPEKAAWAIKKSIDKYGYKGTPGLISQPLGEENVSLRLNPVLNDITCEIISQIASACN